MELFALRNDLSEGANLLIGLLFCRLAQLMELVGTGYHRVTSLKLVRVDWVPVQEKVGHGTAILCKVLSQHLNLRNRQTIVAESASNKKITVSGSIAGKVMITSYLS